MHTADSDSLVCNCIILRSQASWCASYSGDKLTKFLKKLRRVRIENFAGRWLLLKGQSAGENLFGVNTSIMKEKS